MLSQRELLDQLMGKDRNLVEEDKKVLNQHWYDDNVCKYYICGFCPHDLFYNTKSDLGPCVKIHDDQLKQVFEAEPPSRKTSYQNLFLRLLQSLVDDVDRRKRRGTDRLTMQVQPDVNDPAYIERQKRIDEIKDQQVVLVDQMQELGEQGKVEEACGVLGLYDELEGRIREIEGETDAGVKFITDHEKKMGVCDICGAFLVQNEAESRIQSHLNGKQHVGFSMIREKIEEIKKELEERSAAAPEPQNRDRSRQRSRSPRSSRRSSRGSDFRGRSRSPARRSPRHSSGSRHYDSARRRSSERDRYRR